MQRKKLGISDFLVLGEQQPGASAAGVSDESDRRLGPRASWGRGVGLRAPVEQKMRAAGERSAGA